MSKKKLKKIKEDSLNAQDDKNSEDIRYNSQTVERETEFQRFKTEKDRQEKKQHRSSNTGADGQSQGKSPNGSKTTDNSLIESEKRKRIVIQFKSKEIKHGKSTGTADVVTASRKNHNKGPFGGTERKRLCHSFVVQRDKVVKKKKVELSKLKVKAEQTVLGKPKSSVYDLYVPHKKAERSRKLSEDVRIQKKSPSTSTKTVHHDRLITKKSNILSRTCEEKYKEGYEEFSKNQHANKCTSHYSTETLQQWECCKWKKQDADQVTCNSGTEKRDFEATALCFKKGFPSSEGCEYLEGDEEMQIVEDLHVARIEKRMAQSVVQTCGELTSMEIDLPEQDLNISAGTSPSGLNILVVIDTNIMISHLEFVKSLKSEDIPGVGKLALIIPWVVLQELDNLKKGKMLLHVRQKAIPAVQFIYMCLKNQDSKLWGQSMQLASQKIYGLSDENNDDRVLQCCLQYQSLFPQAVVILCTDDKNLCNKAIVCEVKALCKVDLVTALLNLNVNKHQNCLELQQSKCDAEFQKTKGSDARLTSQFPNIIPDLEKSLGEALSCILETEMKIAFGNLWMEILYLKPPWTLVNLLQCYKKHWVAVFGYVVPRSLLGTVEFLCKHFCTGKTLDTSTAVILLQEIKKLLHAFSLRSDYDGVLPWAYEKVNKLYQTFTEVRSDSEQNLSEDIMVLSKSSPCERMEETIPHLQNCEEKRLPPSTHVAQENRHQEIWSVLEGVWNTMNLYRLEIFQKLESNAVIAKSSFEEAFSGLQKLLAAVNYIREGIRRVLAPNSSFQDIWTLYNFLISNEINNSIKFTAEELYECVSQELYRGRLEVGCCQLAELDHSIKQRHASAHKEAKNRGWL
ncbi:transcriptional protein SWT1 isoform X2 [Numida meleagris]|uniref:transcriptional protein SWT1 isoform X2 n=1 Tax=Numida meleagris TaxID=8996 RepID=UPI000B3E2B06|nr:transcriptional protein SWT1 isoform X2 [Numida meleagris]XP_021259679.1 transcriptional protein SWT1 isoform X2 [Numida meleagris]XP_021259680.1 transcriptional protein SWT1 isoform X2 [Numida meleagris]XP_021259681.1 transcriptional protein SWT1 isoform X2 [Numida meleagris]